MITENLSTLKIHKLTQEQYNRELQAGRIDPNALYLTPDTDSSNIYIQNEEPVNVEDGVLWVDMDANSTGGSGGIGGASVFVQDEEPTDVNTGTLWLDTDEEGTGGASGGVAADIPTFNLSEMGLPAVPLDGTEVSVEVDTTAFREALANGQVKIKLLVESNGVEITDIVSAMHIGWNDGYVLSKIVPFHALYLYEIAVYEGSIYAVVYAIQEQLPDVEEATF